MCDKFEKDLHSLTTLQILSWLKRKENALSFVADSLNKSCWFKRFRLALVNNHAGITYEKVVVVLEL